MKYAYKVLKSFCQVSIYSAAGGHVHRKTSKGACTGALLCVRVSWWTKRNLIRGGGGGGTAHKPPFPKINFSLEIMKKIMTKACAVSFFEGDILSFLLKSSSYSSRVRFCNRMGLPSLVWQETGTCTMDYIFGFKSDVTSRNTTYVYILALRILLGRGDVKVCTNFYLSYMYSDVQNKTHFWNPIHALGVPCLHEYNI